MRQLLFAALVCSALAADGRAQSFGPWRALGRFDFDHAKGRLADPLAPEKAVKGAPSLFEAPDLAASYKGMGGEPVAWRTLGDEFAKNALDCGVIDINKLVPPPASKGGDVANSIVYLYRRIDCDSALELPAWCGSDDSLRLWLNGQLLVDAHVARGLSEHDHSITLRLRPGANHLLAKVGNLGGAYSFRIQPWEKIAQESINEAIDRGCDFLARRQLIDGSWGAWEHWGGGHAAFCAYTLLKCGVPRTHPAVAKALAFMRERPLDTVYSISCAILALAAADDPGDRGLLEDCTARLVGMQSSIGLYDYPVYPDGNRPPVDMSNTLYAALALRAAVKSGVPVSDGVWAKLGGGVLRCLESPHEIVDAAGEKQRVAGFAYRMQEHAFGSTTTGGLSVIAICEELGGKSLPGALKGKLNAAKEQALAWIENNMGWSGNPHHGVNHHYFWIYGIERVGALFNLERLGGIDWYWDGAAYLLKAQKDDGSWNPHGWAHHEYLDTCLALLFLKKATAARSSGEVAARAGVLETASVAGRPRLRITGDTQLTMWISALDDALMEKLGGGEMLEVDRVEYHARLDGEQPEPELIGLVKGGVVKRAELQRFALRHAFARRGKWWVTARLFARAASAKSPAQPASASTDGAGGGAEPLRFDSPELAVNVELAAGLVRLDYAADLERDLLFDARGKFAASSQHSDGEGPQRVCDGSFEGRWRCAAGDEKPWLRLTLDRAIKAERLLLTHALPRPEHSASPRASKVVVVVNQKEQFPLDLDPDVLAKSVLEFGATLAVKELEVRIVECRDRKTTSEPVGFSELELQRKR